MKVTYNITQNKINVKFQTGYYPLPGGGGGDLSNYYTKSEVDVKFLNYYTKVEINSQFLNYYLKTEVDTALATKLDKGNYTGTASDLKSDIDGKANTSHTHTISDVTNLQTTLNGKQKLLSSFDESILIETDGNIEGNVSLFQEYFDQQECELNFTPIQIVAVYQDGIKLSNSEYEIILPKKIKIKEYVDENIQIEYTKLKI